MLDTYRLPLTDRKVKEKQAMKQQKAMLIEERPLRGTNPNRPDGGRCLHSLRT